jgi:hypothetical protein
MKPLRETKLGQWLKSNSPKVLDVVGDVLPNNGVLGIIKNLISKDDGLSPEQKADQLARVDELAKEIFAMEIADTANARDMQKAALAQDDTFSKRFLYYFSMFWSLFSAAYLTAVTFIPIPKENQRVVDLILGFILGTAIAAMFNFFLGSSLGSKNRNDQVYHAITEKLKEK